MTEPANNNENKHQRKSSSARRWIIEATDGTVLRASNVGLILSGSDPHVYSDHRLATKVAEDFSAMLAVHGVVMKLHVKGELP